MRNFRKTYLYLFLAVLLVTMGSWGFLVHRTVHQLAIYALPTGMQTFFYQNMAYLVDNSTRPDTRRNTDSTEATKHFIDLEMFGNKAATRMPLDWESAVKKYTADSLIKYGYVPYHVVSMKNKLTDAFRAGNKDSILFYAADLGHYIADANVPLHTTVNYDGQLTDQKGLHSLWESMIPEIEIGNYNLYTPHQAVYLKNPPKAIWTAVRRAAALLPEMLAKETEVSKQFTDATKFRVQIRRGRESKFYTSEFAKAYAKALQNTINDQLLHTTNLLADFWYTCWVDAGKPDLTGLSGKWKAEDQTKWMEEFNSFQQNKLIEQKLLISKKTAAGTGE